MKKIKRKLLPKLLISQTLTFIHTLQLNFLFSDWLLSKYTECIENFHCTPRPAQGLRPDCARCFWCVIARTNVTSTDPLFSLGKVVNILHVKGVLHLWALFLKTLCIFLKKQSNFGQSILWIWSEMFSGTQKLQFYFSRDHRCEVIVKIVRKSIFSMFWAINQ